MKTFARGSLSLGIAAFALLRSPEGARPVVCPGSLLRLLTLEGSFTILFFLLPVPLDSEKRSEGGFLSPRLQAPGPPAPLAAPRRCPGVLPPPGALWAAAGLVADAVVAAARLEGAAGGAQGVSARDRAAAAMGKGSRPRRTLGPASWAEGRGWTKSAGSGGHPGLSVGMTAGIRAWGWAGAAGDSGSPWQREAAPSSLLLVPLFGV